MTAVFIDSAVHQIRACLAARPDSTDTLEGSAQWWLDGQFPLDVTGAALARLRAAGALECIALGARQWWRRQSMPG